MGSLVASEKTGERAFYPIFRELSVEDSDGFCEYMRMPYAKFSQLADMLSESIRKQDAPMGMGISPREDLALTLHFLGTGESF